MRGIIPSVDFARNTFWYKGIDGRKSLRIVDDILLLGGADLALSEAGRVSNKRRGFAMD
jgi:hypothetical protein